MNLNRRGPCGRKNRKSLVSQGRQKNQPELKLINFILTLHDLLTSRTDMTYLPPDKKSISPKITSCRTPQTDMLTTDIIAARKGYKISQLPLDKDTTKKIDLARFYLL